MTIWQLYALSFCKDNICYRFHNTNLRHIINSISTHYSIRSYIYAIHIHFCDFTPISKQLTCQKGNHASFVRHHDNLSGCSRFQLDTKKVRTYTRTYLFIFAMSTIIYFFTYHRATKTFL